MPLRIREVNNVSILDIEGKIDINSSEIIETVGWLVNTGKLSIILNLENIDMVDYSGLSILAIAYKSAVNHKGQLKFLNVPLSAIELFRIVRLDAVFEVYTSEETAVNSFYEEGLAKMPLRRKFKRLDVHIKVGYKIVSGQRKPKVFSGNALNISGAGIYVYTPYTIPINSLVDLEITLPNHPSAFEASGRVIWLADKELQLHSYPGMGIAFINLAPEKEKLIIDFIDKNITHRAEPL